MNCVFIVIDALDYTRCQQSPDDLLPFLSKYASDGITCENMYSQAPYTEAAAMALYCGKNTLDDHGYMERYNNAEETIFQCFQENGYEVYFNALQPQCHPSSLRKGITTIRYNRGFDFNGFWVYRLNHYMELFDRAELNQQDYLQLERLFDDNFQEWYRFMQDLLQNDESVRMIRPFNKSYDAKSCMDRVKKEKNRYEKNKKEYIMEVLRQKDNHPLFNIPYFVQKDYDWSDRVREILRGDFAKLYKNIRIENLLQNMFNPDVYISGLKAVRDYICRDKTAYKVRRSLIKNTLLMQPYPVSRKLGIKDQPSFRTHINDFLQWLDHRTAHEKPYFACIHVDDIHYPEIFFTYDAKDEDVICDDIKLVRSFMKKRKKLQRGNISADLSLVYADNQCKFLVDEMKRRNQFDQTVFIVTADHGFSYSGYPIRNKPINTFYLENFKIPFFAFGGNIKGSKKLEMCSSVDIPPTVCQLLGLEKPKSFVGKSVLEIQGNEIQTIEYCGGGCPDLSRRELMIAAFDNLVMVAAKVHMNERLSPDCITEVYDLRKDPLQRRNIKKKYTYQKYGRYYDVIAVRLQEIKQSEEKFWNSILVTEKSYKK